MTSGRRWAWGLAAFFAAVIGMNALLVALAVSGAETVSPSYSSERR